VRDMVIVSEYTSSAESEQLLAEFETIPLAELLERAKDQRRERHETSISYSRKVFIPLTHLCRDVCGYCTFAKAPREVAQPFLPPEQVLASARERRHVRQAGAL